MRLVLLFAIALAAAPQEQAEKELIVTISGPQLKGGMVSEITWDGETLLLQGVFAELGGELEDAILRRPRGIDEARAA